MLGCGEAAVRQSTQPDSTICRSSVGFLAMGSLISQI
jgi:hypothetical protein